MTELFKKLLDKFNQEEIEAYLTERKFKELF